MNEIEKLYENAGVSKEVIPCPAKYYGYNCTRNNWDDADCSCDIEGYPPFTAEKQIKLLEFNYKYSRVPDIGYIIELKKYDCPHYEEYGAFDTFQEALCADINYHWEYLTDEEKVQIKEILQ